MDELLKKYKDYSDKELEARRDEIEETITTLRVEFMELGKVADARRQVADLPDPDELEKQIAALQAKRELQATFNQ
jgi:polyhydroxyalkanoate synthesis regulator phasin